MRVMAKNKVILMYKNEYDEIGSFTANRSELLILTNEKCVIYNSGSGYEGEDDHIASRVVELKSHSKFIDDCFSHLFSSYENKENVVDCDRYGGTNIELFQIKVIDIDKIDPRLLNGELYFEYEYEIIKELKFDEYYLIKPFSYSLAGILPSIIWPNFIKPYISPIEVLAKKQWLEEEKILKSNKVFKGICFGSYPQKEEKDEDIIKLLNEKYGSPITNPSWCDFGYKANDYQGGYMFYIDVEHSDNRYRGVYIKEFRPNTSGENIARNFDSVQACNGYEKEKVYWFKYEPLTWVKCGDRYSDKYLCLNVIDAEPMFIGDEFSNDKVGDTSLFFTVSSSLRKWLKDKFAPQAFKEDVINDLKIELLSKDEYLKYFPLKKQRMPRPTDYALIKGYLPDSISRGNDFPFVWTATYIEGFNRMVSISKDGSIIDFFSENHGYITYVYGGVQPSLNILNGKSVPSSNNIDIDFDKLEVKNFKKEAGSATSIEENVDFFTPIKKEEKEDEKSIDELMFDDDLPF